MTDTTKAAVEAMISLYETLCAAGPDDMDKGLAAMMPDAMRLLTALQEEREEMSDDIDGLRSDLSNAIEVAYEHGAIEWTKQNYPNHRYLVPLIPPPPQEGE